MLAGVGVLALAMTACETDVAAYAGHRAPVPGPLPQVFAGIPPHVAFDIEIKMATPDSVPATPPAEVDRMVDATLAAVDAGLAAHGPRLVVFSSFDPDVCLEVKRRWGDQRCP